MKTRLFDPHASGGGTAGGAHPSTQTPQAAQFDQLMKEFMGKVEGGFADLDKKMQAKFEAHAKDVMKLRDDFATVQSRYRERFNAIAEHYHSGGAYRGPFRDAQQAKQVGKFFVALMRKKVSNLEEYNAAVNAETGAEGGVLEAETIIAGIIRNVETYGVFEADARVIEQPTQGAKIIKRTGGLSISYPDLGVSPSESKPSFAAIMPSLTVYSVYTPVDLVMLEDTLAISLADFIAEEMALTLAQATDANGFIGDGTPAYARVMGLFNTAGGADVTAESGDDTFAEVIGATTTYLGKLLGGFPHHADDGSLAIYMHRSIFFGYWGAQDTQGRPLMTMLPGTDGRPTFFLAGYPVRITQVAPKLSDSGASKKMIAAANLRRGWALARHTRGVQFRQSTDYKFLERELSLVMDVRQDIKCLDTDLHGTLQTAAT